MIFAAPIGIMYRDRIKRLTLALLVVVGTIAADACFQV
jgi:hypothetical protein